MQQDHRTLLASKTAEHYLASVRLAVYTYRSFSHVDDKTWLVGIRCTYDVLANLHSKP